MVLTSDDIRYEKGFYKSIKKEVKEFGIYGRFIISFDYLSQTKQIVTIQQITDKCHLDYILEKLSQMYDNYHINYIIFMEPLFLENDREKAICNHIQTELAKFRHNSSIKPIRNGYNYSNKNLFNSEYRKLNEIFKCKINKQTIDGKIIFVNSNIRSIFKYL